MTSKMNGQKLGNNKYGYREFSRKCIKCEDYIMHGKMYSTRELIMRNGVPVMTKIYGCTDCFDSRADFYMYIDLNGEWFFMILSGNEIIKRVESGDIYIDDFDPEKVNPNSYNLRLAPTLATYKHNGEHWTNLMLDANGEPYAGRVETFLDMKKPLEMEEFEIPEDGYILQPGVLYLGRTYERTVTKNLVPMLEGRSSTGRLGIESNICAGFGDCGFDGYWTFEISVIEPVKIYPMIEICQIYYQEISGEPMNYDKGKYQKNNGIQPSMIHREFE